MVMAFRMLAFISMAVGRRVKTNTDDMQHTLQGDNSKPYPYVNTVDKLKAHVAKRVSRHMKLLHDNIREKEFATIAEIANEAEKTSIKEEMRAYKAERAKAADKANALFASEADKAKNRIEEAFQTSKAEMAKEADKARAEFATEDDKAKNGYEEAHQIIAEVSKELNTAKREFIHKSHNEGLQTAKAEAAQLAAKAKAKFINEEWAESGKKVNESGKKVKAELANKADKVKGSMYESTSWTEAMAWLWKNMRKQWHTARGGVTSTIGSAPPGVKKAVADAQDKVGEKIGKKDS